MSDRHRTSPAVSAGTGTKDDRLVWQSVEAAFSCWIQQLIAKEGGDGAETLQRDMIVGADVAGTVADDELLVALSSPSGLLDLGACTAPQAIRRTSRLYIR